MICRIIKVISVSFILILFFGCAAASMYDTAQFRERDVSFKTLALDEEGLTEEQIKAISSTKPPKEFPVDVAIMFVKEGYFSFDVEEVFASNLVEALKKSEKIDRITLIPDFLVPDRISFNTMQELGVRSLSEYIFVFYLNARDIFRSTKIIESQYQINSSVFFIVVDSYTSAMMTSDKLYSKETYVQRPFDRNERRWAQNRIFSLQGQLLGEKIDKLFSGGQGKED